MIDLSTHLTHLYSSVCHIVGFYREEKHLKTLKNFLFFLKRPQSAHGNSP